MTLVLATHPQADAYGSDKMLLQTMCALRDAGHQTHSVFAEAGPLCEVFAAEGLTYDVVRYPVIRRRYLSPAGLTRLAAATPGAVVRLHRYIGAVRPDVVYVNTMLVPHWLLAARIANVPAVCHVREGDPRVPRALAKALHLPLFLSNRIIANSRSTATLIATRASRLEKRTVVVYNGFGAATVADTPATRAATSQLLVAGRLSPIKGQDIAIAALAALRESGLDATLHLAGSVFPGYEWYEQQLRRAADTAGIAQRVVFHGYVADLSALYRECDVVLVPSRSEPFGNVAVEAMLLGRPVVATAVGGLAEVVTDGTTGVLVPPDDSQALADAVAALLGDRAHATRLGTAARASASARFTAEGYAREIERAVVELARK